MYAEELKANGHQEENLVDKEREIDEKTIGRLIQRYRLAPEVYRRRDCCRPESGRFG
jgi:hypothetical protein